jgi:hypothetical protein
MQQLAKSIYINGNGGSEFQCLPSLPSRCQKHHASGFQHTTNTPHEKQKKIQTPTPLKRLHHRSTPAATQLSPWRPMLRTRTRARRSATTTILPRSTGPSLRTGWPTPTMLARSSPTAIIVASPSIRRNAAPHTLSPRAGAKSIHHHVRLADGAAGSAAAEADVASCQPWTARRCESVFESGGEVPVWLDACLGSGRAVGRRELRRAWL